MAGRAKLLAILFFILAPAAYSQGIPYQLNPPAPNARVQFCPVPDGGYPCPTLTTVYSDSAATQVINQPISTGSSGNLSVYFAAGTSSVTVQFLGQGYGPQNRFVVSLGSGSNNSLPGCVVTSGTCLGVATTAAVADWRQAATDGTCTNSSTAISWGTANEITTADIGKVIDIIDNAQGWHNTSKTTIATVNQAAQTGTISQATTGGGCGTPINFIVYTDNAPAFNSVELAIHNSTSHKGIIYYPCGVYGAATAFWNQSGAGDSISYWGGGGGHSSSALGNCTIIKVSPAIMAAVSNTGLAALNPANGDQRDIVLDGESVINTATNAFFVNWSGVNGISDLQFVNFIGTAGNTSALCHINSDNFSAKNLTCQYKDQKAMQCNSLNVNIFNPQFAGNPGLDLGDCVGSFVAGEVGTAVLSAAGPSALTAQAGSGTVMANFQGTQFIGTSTAALVLINKSGAAATQVNLVGPTFNCQHGSNQPLLNIGSGAIVQMSDLSNTNSTVTTGCPGTPTITNAGTFIDGGGNGFGMTGMTVSWSGVGSYFLTCSSFSVAPTISTHFNTSADAIVGANPCSFNITVGTGVATSTGAVTLPVAPAGWNCWAQNQNRAALVLQTGNTTTSSTFTNFGTTFAATNWTNSDTLLVNCNPR